jgi:hypothetical protein
VGALVLVGWVVGVGVMVDMVVTIAAAAVPLDGPHNLEEMEVAASLLLQFQYQNYELCPIGRCHITINVHYFHVFTRK